MFCQRVNTFFCVLVVQHWVSRVAKNTYALASQRLCWDDSRLISNMFHLADNSDEYYIIINRKIYII